MKDAREQKSAGRPDGEPEDWYYEEVFGPLPDPDALTDCQIEALWAEIVERLEEQCVVVVIAPEAPARLRFACLHRELTTRGFPDPVEDMTLLLDACSYYCPGCVQRPWCDAGLFDSWPEDEQAGEIVMPEEVEPFRGVAAWAEKKGRRGRR